MLEIVRGLGQKLIGKDGNRHRKIWDRGSRKNTMRRLIGGLSNIFFDRRFQENKKNCSQPKLQFWKPKGLCVHLMKDLQYHPVSFSWWTWAYVLSSCFVLPVGLGSLSSGNSPSYCKYRCCIPGNTPAFLQWLWPGSLTLATAVCPLPLPSFSVMALPLI